ncbi:hypothetical protein [Acinetobacter sp. 3657]|uniref:hypothetical protein n=1 Tax=Acinetobacter sp. 3657 TaxID=2817764 RepID=UPI0028602982|nr:cell fate (sporulation/competence/biofilm development) regulator YmcA (YheA/YmcA/DUF963 family) [Prolinoborus sp. 3657]
MDKELQNALAWYAAAPKRLVNSGMQSLEAAGEWIWVVLQGDFAEDQSTTQIAVGTVISMIPVVDQICDVRDICANCKKIKEDDSNVWAWIGLIITLIGLFPVLGSLFKGIFKILFKMVQKRIYKLAAKAGEKIDFYQIISPQIEIGIAEVKKHIANPKVQKVLKSMNITNVYKEIALNLRTVKGQLNTKNLLKPFDDRIKDLQQLLEYVNRWGGAEMVAKTNALMRDVKEVRSKAAKMGDFITPVQNMLERTARRFDIEADNAFRATVDRNNFTRMNKPGEPAEIASIKSNKPDWVDKTRRIPYEAEEAVNVVRKKGFPDLNPTVKAGERHPLKDAYATFATKKIKAVTIPEGEVLYRVVDPTSADNSICWMRKAEFDKLKSKSDWRRKFAVWANWNSNGEYVTYTVPKGGLNVWEGPAASQELDKLKGYVLEGGGKQIVLDPKDLNAAYVSQRMPTNWGYDSGLNTGQGANLVGIPTLTNNWR